MKPSAALTLLEACILASKPVLMVGGPGEGKTRLGFLAAHNTGRKIVLSHPAVEDPTDAKGMPWGGPDGVEFFPIGQIKQVVNATEPTVWFIDDLGQATAAMQAAYMQWILARECGGLKLPDCVTIIAATNRRVDRAGVTGLLEPVKSRFATIVELHTDLDEWSQWALSSGIDPMVVAFLRFRPELLSAFKPTADLTNSPVPRTWENLSGLLGLKLPDAMLPEVLGGAVGEGAAIEFLAFRKMYLTLPAVDAILLNPDSVKMPKEPSALCAVATALGHRATEDNFPNIAKFVQRMVEAGFGEYGAMLLRDAMRREPKVTYTAAFTKLAAGELGQLIVGGSF